MGSCRVLLPTSWLSWDGDCMCLFSFTLSRTDFSAPTGTGYNSRLWYIQHTAETETFVRCLITLWTSDTDKIAVVRNMILFIDNTQRFSEGNISCALNIALDTAVIAAIVYLTRGTVKISQGISSIKHSFTAVLLRQGEWYSGRKNYMETNVYHVRCHSLLVFHLLYYHVIS